MDRSESQIPMAIGRLTRLIRVVLIGLCGGTIGCHTTAGWTWDYGSPLPIPVLSPHATRRMPELIESTPPDLLHDAQSPASAPVQSRNAVSHAFSTTPVEAASHSSDT